MKQVHRPASRLSPAGGRGGLNILAGGQGKTKERIVSVAEKIKLVEDKFLRNDLPKFNVGDTLRMKIKVVEADKVRIHPYQGTVIAIDGRGPGATFTTRKLAFGEGVERTFPLHSPVLESIKVVSEGKTKRAKLYYLRGRIGKKARVSKKVATP